jgi:putative ABC transport system permease protein
MRRHAATAEQHYEEGRTDMGNLFQDVKYGFQQLRRSPGLAAVAILTLALGIGATTAIFGVVNGWLLKPLPVPNPGQITVITAEQSGALTTQVSYVDFLDLRAQRGPFSDLFGYMLAPVGLSDSQRADHVLVSYVTGNYFSALGLKPYLGRLILPSEGQAPGADPVIVLSYEYWKDRFNGDPNVIGQSLQINGHPVTIVGVTPPDFHGTFTFLKMSAYLPYSMAALDPLAGKSIWTSRESRQLFLMGRLKPGATVEQGQAALNLEQSRLTREFPLAERGYVIYAYPERLARPPEPRQFMRQGMIASLFLLLGGLVLLVACFNVASMLIARALGRQREMALRVSLGASRGRLLSQTLAETLVLALLGGAGGLVLGNWLTGLLSLIHVGNSIPLEFSVQFDWRVYAFAFGACLVTAVVVALAPAFRAFRANPNEELREGGSRLSGGVRTQRLRRALVVTQLAGSLFLLVMAGLFVRGLGKAEHANLGFDPHGVLDLSMNPSDVGYDEAQTNEFYKRLLDRVRAMPGVQSAALAMGAPFSGYVSANSVYVQGRVLGPKEHAPQVTTEPVTPGYLSTMRIPLLRGRTFTDADDEKAPPVAVINQAMASQLWPGQDPLGRQFRTAENGPWIRVIGIAGNVSYVFVADHDRPFFYRPMAQNPISLRTLQIRSAMAPETLTPAVTREIHSLEPRLPVFGVGSLEEALQGPNGFMLFQLGASVAGGLGFLGLVLAVVGLYGVVAYTVNMRRHEIAIRMAIGATARDVFADVLGGGGRMVLVGCVIGIALTALVARGAESILFGVSPFDPLTYGTASLALALVALLACYLPARRATRVDPAMALRYE